MSTEKIEKYVELTPWQEDMKSYLDTLLKDKKHL